MSNYTITINREYKDSVFNIVFSDRKELLSLYNALTDKNYDDPELLQINTLKDAVFINIKNDVSFILGSELNLYEHQSTRNPNIALRGLFYLSDLYKSLYYSEKLFYSTPVPILTPRFIVFYNGNEEVPDQYDIRLSDQFIMNDGTEPDVEVIAHVYNINVGHNEALAGKCKKLREYSIFVSRIREALSKCRSNQSLEPQDEVLSVIRNCIKEDILADILSKEASRIMNSVLENFNMDVFVEAVMADGEAKGEARGEARGIKIGETRGETRGINKLAEVYSLLKSGISPRDILDKGYNQEYIDLAKKMMEET